MANMERLKMKVYVTRPIKTKAGTYRVNMYFKNRYFSSHEFEDKKHAWKLMSEYDNWDKLCKRVPPRNVAPIQLDLRLAA